MNISPTLFTDDVLIFPSFFLDSTATTYTTSEKVDIRPKKPRRHTTGGTKQTQEDILIAKHFTSEMENGGKVINEYGQEIDPNSTLGRKQLISMLKQRYGQDIENYRTSSDVGEKVCNTQFLNTSV